jgi:sugar porter (SP) family MFS transporter
MPMRARAEAKLRGVRARLDRQVLARIALAAAAAGAAWEIALRVPGGHGQPFFAPIAAVIALGAQRGRRGRQAVEMIVGVGIGILVGGGLLAVAGAGGWQIVVGTVVTFVLATAVDAPPVVRVQSAASAILVVALHRPGGDPALQRLVDALIGGGLAIVLARFLFPVEPLELVRDEARSLRERLADALADAATALADGDRQHAERALEVVDGIDTRRLEEALALARDVTRKAPRRRPLRRRLDALGRAWRELELAVADTRAVATGALRVLGESGRSDGAVPLQRLAEAVRYAADAVRTTEPPEAREAAERAREEAHSLSRPAATLGSGVVAHGVIAVAEHALRAADARDEDRRVAEELRRRGLRSRAVRIQREAMNVVPSMSSNGRADAAAGSIYREALRNRRLLGVAAIAAIGGFLFGYDTGVIGGAMLFMQKDLGLKSHGQQELTVAILLLGAIAGALIAGWSADRISRRRTKIISGCVYVIGGIGCALAQSYWQILAARFWLGIAVGCASFVSPMYIAEIVPKRIRGGVVSFNQLMVTLGILSAYIVDWGFAPLPNNWRWMFALAVVPGAALAIGMYFMPFSPRWLVEKGREDDARAVLERYRMEDDDVDAEIDEIKEVAEQEVPLRELVSKGLRRMMIVGIALAVFQQIVGINTVIYYAPTILKFAGEQNTGALTQSVYIGCTNVFFTIVAILLLDKLGRRFFLVGGTSLLTAALVGLGIFFASGAVQGAVPWLALACLLLYIMGFAVGLGPVFWLMISEIFPLQMRGPAMAVCTMFNWGLNFAISYTFLTLTDVITKQGTFWLYAFFGVCAVIFFLTVVPETKDRSLEEIQSDLGAEADQPLARDRSGEREHARA